MNGLDGMNRWKNLKERLSLKGLGCCGATWSTRATIRTIIEEEQEEDEEQPIIFLHDQFTDPPPLPANAPVGNGATTTAPRRRMMNLGMALAAERNFRRSNVGHPKVKTLMRLIEETDGVDLGKRKKRREEEFGIGNVGRSENDWVCCVCMERNKGAALIPCGHAFCRICSREMWDTRGCCPICNRSILEILDIF